MRGTPPGVFRPVSKVYWRHAMPWRYCSSGRASLHRNSAPTPSPSVQARRVRPRLHRRNRKVRNRRTLPTSSGRCSLRSAATSGQRRAAIAPRCGYGSAGPAPSCSRSAWTRRAMMPLMRQSTPPFGG